MSYSQQEIAFNNLMVRNNATIVRLCMKYCGGNAFYFDELRQECTLAIWAEFKRYGLNRFRGDSAESTWINQISFNAIAVYYRNHKPQEYQSICGQFAPDYLTDSENRDDWKLLDDLFEQLNNRERVMFDHFLNEDSYATIAHIEGITEDNARKRMSRLLNKLKMLIHK
ncbi:MAG: sigma-70 family RNA polymerase sigma factor [Bacteroidales bacterium]|nr:sigma-70 family RNA polymerase sigma factor [Candidatus Colimorpha pelethequi]MCQ2264417.1 sigma-70 family RNA polymerase sigma factor [Bacteroidales bacterium]